MDERFPVFLFLTSALAGALALWAALARGPDADTIRAIAFLYWAVFLPLNLVALIFYGRKRRHDG